MKQEVKRTQRDYFLTFKLSVVDQVERGELSCSEAQRRYGIQSHSTVLTWLRKHGHQDWSRGASAPRLRSPTMDSIPLTPEQRIKELETKLFDAEQKAEFFKAVIEVLDKDFGVQYCSNSYQELHAQYGLRCSMTDGYDCYQNALAEGK